MLKSVTLQLYRHMSSTSISTTITTVKKVNSYWITLSDAKTRYITFLIFNNFKSNYVCVGNIPIYYIILCISVGWSRLDWKINMLGGCSLPSTINILV